MLATEAVGNIAIPQNTKKILSVINLRDTEQGILNYMLLSNSNFLEIKNKLSEDDFTFLIHKLIFKHLIILEEMFLSDNYHGVTDLGTLLEIFAEILEKNHNIKLTSTLDILSQTPSIYIDSDLEIMNANSMEKEIAIHSNEVQKNGTIETKDGLTWFSFINDRLISVGTTNI
jgi:replicative DNA helicase